MEGLHQRWKACVYFEIGPNIKKPKFNKEKAVALDFTMQLAEHMKAMTVAKYEKSKAGAYIMVLVKKNGIKATLYDVTSKPTVTDMDAPLSTKIIVQRTRVDKKEKTTGRGK